VAEDSADRLSDADVLSTVRSSARGWHGVQLAVIAFIGLCGALERGAGGDAPVSIQTVAIILVVVALVLACAGVALVAFVAWPVSGAFGHAGGALPGETGTSPQIDVEARRLRRGITSSFVAVALVATASTAGWWPRDPEPSPLVQVTAGDGVWCGTLITTAVPGAARVQTAHTVIDVPLAQVTSIRPVASCD
jgi:hypothetical protein